MGVASAAGRAAVEQLLVGVSLTASGRKLVAAQG